jgi:hypothetical protein
MVQFIFQLLPFIIPLPFIVFWLWMLWEMTKNDTLSRSAKDTWAIAFIVLNVFAAAFYFISVYRKR